MKYLKYTVFLTLLIPVIVLGYTSAPVDITQMSITDIEDSLNKGYLTSELLVTLYQERIEAYNNKFNVINQLNTNALEEAKTLDKEREEGHIRSKLHGIPVLVKTNIDVQGLATTAGSKALKDNYPNDDALIIQKLKDAGAIIIGSTNMSEFAFEAVRSYSSYGNVKNAFNTSYTPYGSSGGSAVGVAASLAAASLGTDTNSSVRLPAAAAGLVGLRPSLGLVSRIGIIPYDTERDTAGIITKTVEDNALILEIIAGYDESDDKSVEMEIPKYSNTDIDISNIKVLVIDSYTEGSVNKSGANSKTDEEIVNLTNNAIKLLEESGVEVVHADELLNTTYLNIGGSTMSGITFCDGFNNYIKNTTGKIRSFKELSQAGGKVFSISGYVSGCGGTWKSGLTSKNQKKSSFENQVLKVMEESDADIILYPSAKKKISPLYNIVSPKAPGSNLGSVIGYPSITIPAGYIDGFPYGIELFAKKYNEDLLYDIASYFENLLNLDLTNSPLTPSLYVVPEFLDELKAMYELRYDDKRYEDIIQTTKEFFKDYSKNSTKENQDETILIIDKYNLREKELKQIERTNNNLFHIMVILIFTIVLRIIIIEFRKLVSKA